MSKRISDLAPESKQQLLRRILEQRMGKAPVEAGAVQPPAAIPESWYRIEKFSVYAQGQLYRQLIERSGLENVFFLTHDGIAADTTTIAGTEYVNFSTYNYLALNGHPRIAAAAKDAIDRYGTTSSASRLVSGERPPHRELERALAELHGVEDAVAFVSGHATNISTIAALFGPKDLILHDRLAHNSIVMGAQLSGAQRQPFPHNDIAALDDLLTKLRHRHEKVLIVVEGIYGMDGDTAPLAELVEIKKRHKALLMVDEAHSMGVLGATGRGIAEHAGIPGAEVDIWMGTLSKSLVGCGGYIAGSAPLVDLLKMTAPGFVYSVGMPPSVAAASRAAIEVMLEEPERVTRLRENAKLFLDLARARGLDTGTAEGHNIVPVITGKSALAGRLSSAMLKRGFNVQPILYPAVEERAARLRFFMSAAHKVEQIRAAVEAVGQELDRLRQQEEMA